MERAPRSRNIQYMYISVVCVVWCGVVCVCGVGGWVRISSEQSSEQLHGGGKVPVSYQQRTHKALICKIRYNSYNYQDTVRTLCA